MSLVHPLQLVQMFGSAKEALGHYHTPVDWEVNRWQAFWERFGLWKHRCVMRGARVLPCILAYLAL